MRVVNGTPVLLARLGLSSIVSDVIQHSEHLDALFQAVEEVHTSLKPIKTNAVGSDNKPYADVYAIRSALRPLLHREGLAVIQAGGVESVQTLICHGPSGQWLYVDARTGQNENGEWAFGARHALMLAFGIRTKVDLGWSVPTSVFDVFERFRLSTAQRTVIAKSGKSPAEMIAEAEKIGSGR